MIPEPSSRRPSRGRQARRLRRLGITQLYLRRRGTADFQASPSRRASASTLPQWSGRGLGYLFCSWRSNTTATRTSSRRPATGLKKWASRNGIAFGVNSTSRRVRLPRRRSGFPVAGRPTCTVRLLYMPRRGATVELVPRGRDGGERQLTTAAGHCTTPGTVADGKWAVRLETDRRPPDVLIATPRRQKERASRPRRRARACGRLLATGGGTSLTGGRIDLTPQLGPVRCTLAVQIDRSWPSQIRSARRSDKPHGDSLGRTVRR